MNIKFFKSNKCNICKQHRATRFCLRTGKEICWHDCNLMRVDMNCNKNCRYALKSSDDNFFSLKTNADSNAEYRDLLMKQIDKWVMLPQEIFNNETPLFLSESESGREMLLNFFSQFKANDLVPLRYLYKRLHLKYPYADEDNKNDQESVAHKFMELIVAQDWEATIEMLYLNDQYKDPKYKENYLERLSQHKIIKKIVEFDLISAGMNKEQDQALVYFDVNGKYDLTLLMRKRANEWKVGAKIFGKPEIYTRENEAIKQVAGLLSKNQLAHAYDTLKKFSDIFTDSADFQYYWGFYYLMSKMEKKAQKFLFNAIVIEPGFFDAKALYATTLITDKKFDEAKKLYEEILEIYPQEIKSLNNLASIYLEERNLDKAEELLKRCLEIDPNFEFAIKNMEKLEQFRSE